MLAALGEIIRTMVLESLCRGGYFGVVQPIDDETAIQAAVAHVRYTYPGAGCINKHRTDPSRFTGEIWKRHGDGGRDQAVS